MPLSIADLVEEQRAAVRELDQSRLGVHGAGERALLVAEQLGLEDLTGQRATVQRDERAVGARGSLVDGARDELFARTALAQHEHRGVGRRHALDDAQHFLHPRAAREDAAERLRARRPRAQGDVVTQELALLRRLAHEEVELLHARGLAQVVVGAELHRFHRRRHVLHAGHHDDLGRVGRSGQLAQHVDATLARHLHVEDEHVVRRLRDAIDRGLAVFDTLRVVALARELAHDELAQRPLVVRHEHAHAPPRRAHAGSTMRNTAPSPGFVVTSMRPP